MDVQPLVELTTVPAILLALNEGLKRLGMDSKYCILVNWIGGVSLSVLLTTGQLPLIQSVLLGFIAGSLASGIYKDVKRLSE